MGVKLGVTMGVKLGVKLGVKWGVKWEETRYARGSYKRTIPYRQTASQTIVQHEVINFLPALLA